MPKFPSTSTPFSIRGRAYRGLVPELPILDADRVAHIAGIHSGPRLEALVSRYTGRCNARLRLLGHLAVTPARCVTLRGMDCHRCSEPILDGQSVWLGRTRFPAHRVTLHLACHVDGDRAYRRTDPAWLSVYTHEFDCRACGRHVVAVRRGQLSHCSPVCASTRRHVRVWKRTSCMMCGAAFDSRPDRLTCSPKCRVALHRWRKKRAAAEMADSIIGTDDAAPTTDELTTGSPGRFTVPLRLGES